eukprot:GHVN01102837.1.p1 GENE.GHVN01102837.1~~GHVN01102837.1.p1  ORF type:complete len:1343 (-),score=387.66 GHVN01102837.1:274-4302(-)
MSLRLNETTKGSPLVPDGTSPASLSSSSQSTAVNPSSLPANLNSFNLNDELQLRGRTTPTSSSVNPLTPSPPPTTLTPATAIEPDSPSLLSSSSGRRPSQAPLKKRRTDGIDTGSGSNGSTSSPGDRLPVPPSPNLSDLIDLVAVDPVDPTIPLSTVNNTSSQENEVVGKNQGPTKNVRQDVEVELDKSIAHRTPITSSASSTVKSTPSSSSLLPEIHHPLSCRSSSASVLPISFSPTTSLTPNISGGSTPIPPLTSITSLSTSSDSQSSLAIPLLSDSFTSALNKHIANDSFVIAPSQHYEDSRHPTGINTVEKDANTGQEYTITSQKNTGTEPKTTIVNASANAASLQFIDSEGDDGDDDEENEPLFLKRHADGADRYNGGAPVECNKGVVGWIESLSQKCEQGPAPLDEHHHGQQLALSPTQLVLSPPISPSHFTSPPGSPNLPTSPSTAHGSRTWPYASPLPPTQEEMSQVSGPDGSPRVLVMASPSLSPGSLEGISPSEVSDLKAVCVVMQTRKRRRRHKGTKTSAASVNEAALSGIWDDEVKVNQVYGIAESGMTEVNEMTVANGLSDNKVRGVNDATDVNELSEVNELIKMRGVGEESKENEENGVSEVNEISGLSEVSVVKRSRKKQRRRNGTTTSAASVIEAAVKPIDQSGACEVQKVCGTAESEVNESEMKEMSVLTTRQEESGSHGLSYADGVSEQVELKRIQRKQKRQKPLKVSGVSVREVGAIGTCLGESIEGGGAGSADGWSEGNEVSEFKRVSEASCKVKHNVRESSEVNVVTEEEWGKRTPPSRRRKKGMKASLSSRSQVSLLSEERNGFSVAADAGEQSSVPAVTGVKESGANIASEQMRMKRTKKSQRPQNGITSRDSSVSVVRGGCEVTKGRKINHKIKRRGNEIEAANETSEVAGMEQVSGVVGLSERSAVVRVSRMSKIKKIRRVKRTQKAEFSPNEVEDTREVREVSEMDEVGKYEEKFGNRLGASEAIGVSEPLSVKRLKKRRTKEKRSCRDRVGWENEVGAGKVRGGRIPNRHGVDEKQPRTENVSGGVEIVPDCVAPVDGKKVFMAGGTEVRPPSLVSEVSQVTKTSKKRARHVTTLRDASEAGDVSGVCASSEPSEVRHTKGIKVKKPMKLRKKGKIGRNAGAASDVSVLKFVSEASEAGHVSETCDPLQMLKVRKKRGLSQSETGGSLQPLIEGTEPLYVPPPTAFKPVRCQMREEVPVHNKELRKVLKPKWLSALRRKHIRETLIPPLSMHKPTRAPQPSLTTRTPPPHRRGPSLSQALSTPPILAITPPRTSPPLWLTSLGLAAHFRGSVSLKEINAKRGVDRLRLLREESRR